MKTKFYLLLTLLLYILSFGGSNAWAGQIVGKVDNTSTYRSAFSDEYTLTPGDQLHYEFINYTNKDKNWYNWLLEISGAKDDLFILRPDYWWDCGSYNRESSGDIGATITNLNIDWEHFLNDMDGASVVIDVTHGGSSITVETTATNNGRTYTENLTLPTNLSTANVKVKLSIEHAHLVINKVKLTYDFVSVINSRFSSGNNWVFKNSSYYNNGGGFRSFTINDLFNGDEIIFIYTKNTDSNAPEYDAATFTTLNAKEPGGSLVTSTSVLASGSSYLMASDGNLDLSFHRYVGINSVIITRYPEDVPAISFSQKTFDKQVAGTNFTEPTLTVTPSTATAYYSSSNTSVATVNQLTGEVTLVGGGNVTITATLTVGGTTVSDSYDLTVLSATTTSTTYNYVGSGYPCDLVAASTPEVNGEATWLLDFNGRTYGATTFNLNNIVAVAQAGANIGSSGDRWFLSSGGICNYFNSDRTMYVLNLENGDIVSIAYALHTDGSGSASCKVMSSNTNVASEAPIASGEEITMTESGELKLAVGAKTMIQSITIYHETASSSFTWSDAALSTKFDTSTGGKILRYDLSTLNFQEPTAVVVPATATYTITSLNTNVALMSTTNFGDILFVNTGSVNIRGNLKINGQDKREVYTVDVWANNANYDERGNTCYMSETGKLNADRKTVTAIAGITMEFGSAEDATLIVEDPSSNSGKLVAYTINKNNGWRHRYPYNSVAAPSEPTNGSFYKFTALTNGTLSFKGVKNGGANTVVLVDATNLSSPLITIAAKTWGYCESTTATLTAGHVYYLYGNVPAQDDTSDTWSAFLLSEFTFNSEFKLTDSSGNEVSYGSTAAGVTSATDVVTIAGVANPVVSIAGYSGNITAATLSVSNGKLQVTNITGTGGAIRIKISDGGSGVRYFTLTVPYGAHVWDFRTGTTMGFNGQTTTEIVSHLKSQAADATLALSGLTRTYKVVSKTPAGVWTSLIDPIIAVNGRVEGDNGFYFDKTAGLIFVTRSSGFGVKETECTYYTVTEIANGHVSYYSSESAIPNEVKNNSNYTVSGPFTEELTGDKYSFDDEAQYRLTYEATQKGDYLMMKGTSTVIFPGVKAGQYIKIYTYRHSDSKGETYYAKNLTDLDNHTYSTSNTFVYHGILSGDGSNKQAIRNCYGAAIFKVPSTYVEGTDISQMPAITLSDDGWTRIYKIEVCDEYTTNMQMSLDRGTYPEFIDMTPNCEYASVVIHDNKPVTHHYSGVATQIHVENAGTCTFEFEVVDGNVDYTVTNRIDRETYNLADVTYNSGRGVVKITQREIVNGYTIDKQEFYVAVNSLTSKTYPYTWDFTNYNMFKSPSTTTTNLGSLTAGNYGTWSNESGTYSTSFTIPKDFKDNNNVAQNATTTKVLFAHGSELCAGNTPISETAGLGIEGPYSTTTIQRSTGGNTYDYSYKTYNNTNGTLAINGNTLTGVGTITIPQVDNGMYVFVKASAGPTATTGLTSLWLGYIGESVKDPFNVADGVWLYQQRSTKQDVTLSFAETTNVEVIAVTNEVKTINELGYASESRSHAIDHTYQAKLTKQPVKAYGITTYGGETYTYKGYPEVRKSANAVTVLPANTGIVLYQDPNDLVSGSWSGTAFSSPLFYPAVNVTPTTSDQEILAANWMAPNVNEKVHTTETIFKKTAMSDPATDAKGTQDGSDDVECTKFGMSRTYYVYDKPTSTSGDAVTTNVEAFYRLKIVGNSTEDAIGANKAYLLIPTANLPLALWDSGNGEGSPGLVRQGMIYMDLEEQMTTVDIEQPASSSKAESTQPVYYTLSGMRLNGIPKQTGVYICNGKLISIK